MYSPSLPAIARTCLIILMVCCLASSVTALTPREELGKALFFDEKLSLNENQSCASCHSPETGYTGPDSSVNEAGAVYEGSVAGRFGNRKPPTAAYGGDTPILHFTKKFVFVGGTFWDGRATGERLGSPLAEQAQGPFLNPLEQALASPLDVCTIVQDSSYADLYEEAWGETIDCSSGVNEFYDRVGLSIAAYEGSSEVSPFSSKYDLALKGKARLTSQERRGFALFQGKGGCSACHISTPGKGGTPALFTDFTYDNLGVPRNEENPFYTQTAYNPDGDAWVDPGLGGFLNSRPDYETFAPESMGKMKVPTLRNVDQRPDEGFVKAYGHNGFFKSLDEIVHFYNTRDVLPVCPDEVSQNDVGVTCWPAPEIAANINTAELGNLGLTADEEAAIVAFMKTLSDGYGVTA